MATDYQTVAWIENKPDCYAGESCDEIVNQWDGYWDGDKEGGPISGDIILDPKLYPPGTKITIEAPCCPDCGIPAEVEIGVDSKPTGNVLECECGFDWRGWTLDQYS